jgi:hypothetical protein
MRAGVLSMRCAGSRPGHGPGREPARGDANFARAQQCEASRIRDIEISSQI